MHKQGPSSTASQLPLPALSPGFCSLSTHPGVRQLMAAVSGLQWGSWSEERRCVVCGHHPGERLGLLQVRWQHLPAATKRCCTACYACKQPGVTSCIKGPCGSAGWSWGCRRPPVPHELPGLCQHPPHVGGGHHGGGPAHQREAGQRLRPHEDRWHGAHRGLCGEAPGGGLAGHGCGHNCAGAVR